MSAPEALKQITAQLANGTATPRTCLIICPDLVRQQRVLSRLYESLNKSAERITLSADSLSDEGIRNHFFSLQNSSLFTNENQLIISAVDALSAATAKTMLGLIDDLPSSAVVILCATKLASNLSLYKFYAEKKLLFSLDELVGVELEKWIAKELSQQGVKKFPPSTPSIIRQASQDSADVAFEIAEKIALYLDGSELTLEELQRLVPVEARIDEFDFIAKIATTKRPQLEAMVHQLFNQGVSPFPLLSLLHKNYASYHALGELLRKGVAIDHCAKLIGSPPWLVKKIAPLAQRYSSERLKICLAAIARADSKLKNRSLGYDDIFSELLESLAA